MPQLRLPNGETVRIPYSGEDPAKPGIRPLSRVEVLADDIREIYRNLAEQPLGRVTDLLGLTDLAGMGGLTDQTAPSVLTGVPPLGPKLPPRSQALLQKLLANPPHTAREWLSIFRQGNPQVLRAFIAQRPGTVTPEEFYALLDTVSDTSRLPKGLNLDLSLEEVFNNTPVGQQIRKAVASRRPPTRRAPPAAQAPSSEETALVPVTARPRAVRRRRMKGEPVMVRPGATAEELRQAGMEASQHGDEIIHLGPIDERYLAEKSEWRRRFREAHPDTLDRSALRRKPFLGKPDYIRRLNAKYDEWRRYYQELYKSLGVDPPKK